MFFESFYRVRKKLEMPRLVWWGTFFLFVRLLYLVADTQ